ncbi:MAG: flagellar motor switch protein FliN [Methyloversatilis sp.]|nr:flagellar motor switch protein FliN [Methyloversatilis sp.]MBP6194410.1 flagellar motor switch protein FliN [Methyloversatilis sp.]MBP9117125.1 flagellar motor switch protein FliN [Methyloversatilis sp.]
MSDLAEAEQQVSEDDWAAAMSEQTTADEALAALDESAVVAKEVQPANIFQQFGDAANKSEGLRDFEMILDIPVQLTVELGRTKISIRNLLQLGHGSVVELDGMAGEPMDVLVNGTLIAQGEVVVVNEKFGIRLTDIITPAERMKKLKR